MYEIPLKLKYRTTVHQGFTPPKREGNAGPHGSHKHVLLPAGIHRP